MRALFGVGGGVGGGDGVFCGGVGRGCDSGCDAGWDAGWDFEWDLGLNGNNDFGRDLSLVENWTKFNGRRRFRGSGIGSPLPLPGQVDFVLLSTGYGCERGLHPWLHSTAPAGSRSQRNDSSCGATATQALSNLPAEKMDFLPLTLRVGS